jgi:hypothetical protein
MIPKALTLFEITGAVVEADVEEMRFQIAPDEGGRVSVPFTEAQEAQIAAALRDHRHVRLRIRGKGEISPDGKIVQIHQADEISAVPNVNWKYDPTARPIWEAIEEISMEAPDEEWAKLPSDLSENHDHYLYGVPKR